MKDYSAKNLPKKPEVAEPRSMKLKSGFSQIIKSLITILTIALVGYVVSHLPGYYSQPIDPTKITIQGNHILTNDVILSHLQLPKARSWFDTDPFELSQRLAQHSWVDNANIHRRPDLGLTISITEITPLSYLQTLDGLFLLGSDFRVLSMMTSGGRWNLPVIVDKKLSGLKPGALIPKHELQKGIAMIRFLEKSEILPLKNVSEIDISDPLNIQLITIPDAILIKMGSAGFEQKIINLNNSLPRLQKERGNIRYIDLRYDKAVVFRNKV
jgi:cell division septal protein FtsQ